MLLSSAVAFRLFLFFIPLVLFVVGAAGFLAELVEPADVNETVGVTGQIALQIERAFEQSTTTRWFAVLTGLVGMATTGRSLSRVLCAASSLAWRMPVVAKARIKVIGAIVGLVTGLVLMSTIVNRIRAEFGVPAASVSFLAVGAVYVVIWLVLFWMLPRTTPDPSVLLPGAAVVALTQTLMQLVSQLYLPGQLGRASQLYGSVGVAVVTLGWFFFLGRAIVVAMSVNAVVHERHGSISHLVFALPLLRILPRRSATVRRFFGLDG